MKAGTVILSIVLILFVSLVSLGYLYGQVSVLHASNQSLEEQNILLNNSLDELNAIHESDQQKITELLEKEAGLQAMLEEERSAKQYYANLASICEQQPKNAYSSLSISGVVIVPTLFAMIFAAVKFAKRLKKQARLIKIYMTREQIHEYIQYQRNTKGDDLNH